MANRFEVIRFNPGLPLSTLNREFLDIRENLAPQNRTVAPPGVHNITPDASILPYNYFLHVEGDGKGILRRVFTGETFSGEEVGDIVVNLPDDSRELYVTGRTERDLTPRLFVVVLFSTYSSLEKKRR